MTDSSSAASGSATTRMLLALALIAVLGGGIALLVRHLTARPDIPPVATESLEPTVASLVQQARQDLLDDPKNPEKWAGVGLAFFANDLYAESRPWLEHAERLDPQEPRWPYLLGLVYLLVEPEKAVASLRQASTLAPRDIYIRLRLAEAMLKLDQREDADAMFAEVLAARPNDPRAHLGRGMVLLKRGDAGPAVNHLERAADDPTSRKAARTALAQARLQLSEEKAAAEQQRLASELPKDADWRDPHIVRLFDLQVNLQARLTRADAMIRTGLVEEGLALLQRAVADRPDAAEARLGIGKALVRLNQFDRAETELLKAIDLDPTLPDAHFLLAGMALSRNDPIVAEPRYRRVLELRPTDALAHFNIAECRLRQNDPAGAIESLKAAVRFRPGFAAGHLQLGRLLLESGKTAEAVSSLETATQIDPNDAKAKALLEQARARKPK